MKYLLLLLTAFITWPTGLCAQAIRFEQDSLSQVFDRARQQHKPVFVLVAPPPPPAGSSARVKAARTQSGLKEPSVAAALNTGFLSKELAFGKRESVAAARKYQVSSYPTYLYFSPDGSLVYRSVGNSTTAERYLKNLQAVQVALADPHNLSYFQTEFEKGNRSADFLKAYILKRRQLGQAVEAELLNTYALQLPAHALYRAPEVVFILQSGPVLGSQAFQLSHLNKKLTDSLYAALPLAQRVGINNQIISHTIAQAIATKDRALAAQGADFARASWNTNYARGGRSYEVNMLAFFQGIKDTASYLRQAVGFYDRYYMSVSADSARKAALALHTFRQAQRRTWQQLDSAAARPANTDRVTAVQPAGTGLPGAFLTELNNAAWAIYQTGTRRQDYLLRAMLWSRRTVALDPAAYNYDTLAHLLYRLRFYGEAAAMQQQAVVFARQEKEPFANYQLELQKMQKHTL